MDQNLQISVSALTTTLNRYSKRAITNTEKKYLFEIVEGLGTAIIGQKPEVQLAEFQKACGVQHDWGQVAA